MNRYPGTDIYDPENDPGHDDPIGENWPNGAPICSIIHDIDFDAKLDASLFSFEPPEGYTLHSRKRNYVTEQEMVDYIGILAEVNDDVFPGQTYPGQLSLDGPDNERWEQIWEEGGERANPPPN